MEPRRTFLNWKERREKNLKDQAKHNYSILYIDRLEAIQYSDSIMTISLETSVLPHDEVNISHLLDKYTGYDSPELMLALKRIISFLTVESKNLYLECRNVSQSNQIGALIANERLVDTTLWLVKVIENNIGLFFGKAA